MAFALIKNDNILSAEGSFCEYLIESSADVSSLPTGATGTVPKPRPGSTALDESTGELYILTVSRVWAILPTGA